MVRVNKQWCDLRNLGRSNCRTSENCYPSICLLHTERLKSIPTVKFISSHLNILCSFFHDYEAKSSMTIQTTREGHIDA